MSGWYIFFRYPKTFSTAHFQPVDRWFYECWSVIYAFPSFPQFLLKNEVFTPKKSIFPLSNRLRLFFRNKVHNKDYFETKIVSVAICLRLGHFFRRMTGLYCKRTETHFASKFLRTYTQIWFLVEPKNQKSKSKSKSIYIYNRKKYVFHLDVYVRKGYQTSLFFQFTPPPFWSCSWDRYSASLLIRFRHICYFVDEKKTWRH